MEGKRGTGEEGDGGGEIEGIERGRPKGEDGRDREKCVSVLKKCVSLCVRDCVCVGKNLAPTIIPGN
jgi:hypothetical protein